MHCYMQTRMQTSSVASPICQEGQSERTFPIFAFSSRFFLFFPSFPLLFPDFWHFFWLSGVALCPLAPPPVATPLQTDLPMHRAANTYKDNRGGCGLLYVRHFDTGYGIFHCDSMKYDLMLLHWITMKYTVSRMKMPQVRESATSVITLLYPIHIP